MFKDPVLSVLLSILKKIQLIFQRSKCMHVLLEVGAESGRDSQLKK